MTNYIVSPIEYQETIKWLKYKHYAKRMPSISYSFGLYKDNILIGICTYGSPPSNSLCNGVCGIEYKNDVIELNRLCLNDHKEKNITSYFVSKTLKMLGNKIVVSYADTSQGHIGVIYQASNFLYTGLSDKRTEWRMKNCELHSKTICEKYTLKQRQNNNDFYVIDRPRKHRYIIFVGDKKFKKEAKESLKYKIKPYPKGKTERYNADYIPETQMILF